MGESTQFAGEFLTAPTLILLLAVLLILVGLILAFRGRKLWAGLMSMIGAVIGGSLGFLFGLLLNNWIAALILSMVGAFMGSVLFGYIVKIALAFVTSLLVAGLIYVVMGPGYSQDTRVAVAVVVLLVSYTIAYWFIQEIIALVTAALGGILIGVGIYLAGLGATAALALGGLSFLLGLIVQTLDYRREKRRRVSRAVVRTYPAPQQTYYVSQAPPAPAPSPPVSEPSPPPPSPPPGE